MSNLHKIRTACTEGRYSGAEGITRIGQTVGRYATVTLIRFDGYDAVGDSYGVVHDYTGADGRAMDVFVRRYPTRNAAASAFAEAAEISGL